MKSASDVVLTVITILGVLLFVAMLIGFPTMWLWNWIMPELFGLPLIGFWKAVGINLLSAILFGKTNYSSKSS